jgi:hypothetical protein
VNHQEKVDHLLNDLAQRGVGKYSAAPPIYRLLWRMGYQVPPPHFAGFWPLALIMGAFFAVLWGLLMWVFFWRGESMPIAIAIVSSLITGLLFGVAMAAYFRWSAKRLGLPRWEDYPAAR